MAKEKLLTDLYSLRAGLSVISQQKDSVEKIQKKTNTELKNVQDDLYRKASIVEFNGDVETVVEKGQFEKKIQDYCEQKKREKSCEISDLQSQIADEKGKVLLLPQKLKTAKEENHKESIKSLVLALLAFVGAGLFVWLTVWKVYPQYEKWLLGFYLLIGCGLVAIVATIAGIWLLVLSLQSISTKDLRNDIKRNKFSSEARIKDWNAQIATIQLYYNEADKYLDLIPLGAKAVKERNEIRAKADVEMSPYVQVSTATLKALLDTYSQTLDQRDWMYLDLVIYYIETNRAESIREALQLVDRERQTQQIVTTVQQATATISLTIQDEMSAMRKTINAGFDQLSDVISSEISALGSQVKSLNATVSSGFAESRAIAMEQLKQSAISNALKAKANATSEQLAADVSYMRQNVFYSR